MEFQLVDDVLMEILDFAYQNNQHLPDYQVLRTFSLVSKAWGYEAQKRLFSEGLLVAHKDPVLSTHLQTASLTEMSQSIYQDANIFIYLHVVYTRLSQEAHI
jgi:hypothetical protein